MKIKQIIIGITFSLVLILLIFQQTMPGDGNNSRLNQSEDREQQKEPFNQSWTENSSNATLEKQPNPSNETRKKSNFTCAKPPVLCVCKNFLSLNRAIITSSDLDDAIDLFLNESNVRRENASIQIGEDTKTGWYSINVMNKNYPGGESTFQIEKNTGDFWYLFGCV